MPQDCANRLFEKIVKQYFILDEDYVNPIDYDSGYCEVISCNNDIGQIKKGTKISRICFFDENLHVWLNEPEDDLYRIDNADVVLKVNILCRISKC